MACGRDRILVVSDDRESADLLRSVIGNTGFEVTTTADPDAAVACAGSAPAPRLAIVDLRLPAGARLCGDLREAAEARGRLSVLGLVPPDREDLLEAALAAGVDDLLCPPLSPLVITARVRAVSRRVRLDEALADQARELELILDLTRRLAASIAVDDILYELVSRVAVSLGVDRCSLVLSDLAGERGLVVAASDDERVDNLEIDLSGYPEIQEVLRTQDPLVIQDATGHPLVAAVKDTLSAKGVGALAVLPLQHHEEPMGVMFLRSSPSRGGFSERTIRVARTIAHATAVALRNAQMFERVRQQSAQATAEKAVAEKEVADLRQIEAELRKTTDLLENLIDSSANAIVASDMQGRIKVWNEAAEKVLGYSREEALSSINITDVYFDDAREVMTALRAEAGGGPGRLEEHPVHIVSREGERIPVTLSAAILYEDGKEVATVGILTDMRDRLRIEEKLSRAQDRLMRTEKQMMIAELAGTTAHELNQPLTSVMGYAELLKRRIAPTDPSYRAIDIIFRESERMAEIVRKIGRITRYETKDYLGKTRIVDLDRSAGDD